MVNNSLIHFSSAENKPSVTTPLLSKERWFGFAESEWLNPPSP